MFSEDNHDPETHALLNTVFEESWHTLQTMLAIRPLNPEALRHLLAIRLMTAVRDGERNPRRLKRIALSAIEG